MLDVVELNMIKKIISRAFYIIKILNNQKIFI